MSCFDVGFNAGLVFVYFKDFLLTIRPDVTFLSNWTFWLLSFIYFGAFSRYLLMWYFYL